MRFPHVAARVFDTPLLIARSKLDALLSVLGPRLGFDASAASPKLYDDEEDGGIVLATDASETAYTVIDGVALIAVHGTLVQRSSWIDAFSGLRSYEDVSSALAQALADPSVGAIVLDIDSPGGEVAGAFDCADAIFAARGEKPIVAVANELALSGGYLVACAADEVIIPQAAVVGSVGVVWTHVDYSQQNAMIGVAVTHLFKGRHKVDGNPDEPLSEQAKTSIGDDLGRIYDLFVAAVVRNRGLEMDAVVATQADIYRGQAAVEIGLADRIGTLNEIIGQLSESSRPTAFAPGTFRAVSAQTQRSIMTTKATGAAGGDPAAPNDPAAAQAAAEAAINQRIEAARREATVGAVAAERTRIRAITTHAEAAGRTDMAAHLAFETDMSVEQATSLLAKAPKAAAATANPLEVAMASVKNPQVGADTGKADDDDAEAARLAQNIVALHRGGKTAAKAGG